MGNMGLFILLFNFKVNKHFCPQTLREEKMSALHKASFCSSFIPWGHLSLNVKSVSCTQNEYSLMKMVRRR